MAYYCYSRVQCSFQSTSHCPLISYTGHPTTATTTYPTNANAPLTHQCLRQRLFAATTSSVTHFSPKSKEEGGKCARLNGFPIFIGLVHVVVFWTKHFPSGYFLPTMVSTSAFCLPQGWQLPSFLNEIPEWSGFQLHMNAFGVSKYKCLRNPLSLVEIS